MPGFRSPLLPLGVSVSPALVHIGRGNGPLPFTVGVSTAVVTVGRGLGPLPFSMGVLAAPAPITPDYQKGGGSGGGYYASQKATDYVTLKEQLLREDEELIEMLISFVTGDIL